jgi:hypothetical protein
LEHQSSSVNRYDISYNAEEMMTIPIAATKVTKPVERYPEELLTKLSNSTALEIISSIEL